MSAKEVNCPYDPFPVPYLEYAILLPVFILLQLLLLCHSVYHTKKSFDRKVRISFFALQICGMIWILNDILRFVVDPQTLILQNNPTFCNIVGYIPKLIVVVYYGIYLYQLLLRLEVSFKDSFLELSTITKYILMSMSLMPAIGVPVCYLIFLSPACIWIWHPVDFPNWKNNPNGFAFCDAKLDDIGNLVASLGVIWCAVFNIIFATIFVVKLRKMLAQNRCTNNDGKIEIKAVMLKNTILAIIGSLTSVFDYIGWLYVAIPLELGATFLYVDVLIHCLLIALMFNYNERYYQFLCKLCIKLCVKMNSNSTETQSNLESYIYGTGHAVQLSKSGSPRTGTPRTE
eukprot:109061_1